jgi:hypothetical protein
MVGLFKKKFGKYKCPRCGTIQWYKTEEAFNEALKKPFDQCIECFASLKLIVEGKKVKVQCLSGQKYSEGEPAITDEDYKLLKNQIGAIKGLERMQRGMGMIEMGSVLEGDSMSALYWNTKNRQFGSGNPIVNKVGDNIGTLLAKYPKQTRLYFRKKGKEDYLPEL